MCLAFNRLQYKVRLTFWIFFATLRRRTKPSDAGLAFFLSIMFYHYMLILLMPIKMGVPWPPWIQLHF
jgi:hypothetical protein